MVGERYLTRRRHAAAADQGDVRNGVMRVAERPVSDQAGSRWQQAFDAVNAGYVECFDKI